VVGMVDCCRVVESGVGDVRQLDEFRRVRRELKLDHGKDEKGSYV